MNFDKAYQEKMREANQTVMQSATTNFVDKRYYMQLFANLVNASPVDTRNMVTHIVMYETATDYMIEVNAPFATNPKVAKESVNGKSDYAYDVNYKQKSPHYHWIEDQIDLTGRLIGARVTFLDKK